MGANESSMAQVMKNIHVSVELKFSSKLTHFKCKLNISSYINALGYSLIKTITKAVCFREFCTLILHRLISIETLITSLITFP